MKDESTTRIAIGLMAVALAVSIYLNFSKSEKITELQINAAQFEKQYQTEATLRDSIEKSQKETQKEIARLLQERKNIPTDEEVITNNPVEPSTINDSWRTILEPIGAAIDTISRRQRSNSD